MKLSVADQQALVEKHLPIAARLAKHYRGQGASYDDLYQEAAVGLVEAARRFDPDRTPPEHFGEYARSQAQKRVIQLIDAELQSRLPAKLADLPATEPDAHAERASDDLWSAMDILGPDDRDLLADRYGLDGRPAQTLFELCARRGVPMATMKRRLDSLRKQLGVEMIARGWRDRSDERAVRLTQLNIG